MPVPGGKGFAFANPIKIKNDNKRLKALSFIFLNDITNIYKELTDNLAESKYVVAATTEYSRNDLNEERFTNLEMKSNKYLNAGVMFIDLTKWRNQRVHESLIETQIRMGSRLIYWDQDVFNSFLDGEYLEMSQKLNFNPS